jgi:hypothetical protein
MFSYVGYPGLKNPCSLPPGQSGEGKIQCLAAIPKWTFNGAECYKFLYGGCGGNDNMFDTYEECMKTCAGGKASEDAVDPGKGKEEADGAGEKSRFMTKLAKMFKGLIRGRSGKDPKISPFAQLAEAYQGSLAGSQASGQRGACLEQPAYNGNGGISCKASFHRWTFDGSKCFEFVYGGCKGNNNQFKSKEECERVCLSNAQGPIVDSRHSTTAQIIVPPPIINPGAPGSIGSDKQNFTKTGVGATKCQEKPAFNGDEGMCRAHFPVWTFDGSKCFEFIYGGCNGNNNRFKSKEECESTCLSKVQGPIADSSHSTTTQIIVPPPMINTGAPGGIGYGKETGVDVSVCLEQPAFNGEGGSLMPWKISYVDLQWI